MLPARSGHQRGGTARPEPTRLATGHDRVFCELEPAHRAGVDDLGLRRVSHCSRMVTCIESTHHDRRQHGRPRPRLDGVLNALLVLLHVSRGQCRVRPKPAAGGRVSRLQTLQGRAGEPRRDRPSLTDGSLANGQYACTGPSHSLMRRGPQVIEGYLQPWGGAACPH